MYDDLLGLQTFVTMIGFTEDNSEAYSRRGRHNQQANSYSKKIDVECWPETSWPQNQSSTNDKQKIGRIHRSSSGQLNLKILIRNFPVGSFKSNDAHHRRIQTGW